MDADIARRWAAELRSGDYRQGKTYLTRTQGGVEYDCCLGVLCKMAVRDGIIEHQDTASNGVTTYDHENCTLPDSVQKWADLNDADPQLLVQLRGHAVSLAHATVLNDEHEFTFEEIANAIDATVEDDADLAPELTCL